MRIEQVEKILINTVGKRVNQPIKLTDWEKNILNWLKNHNKINKIIIITDRKSGSTSFCKWLHYFKPKGKTFILSDNLYWSKHIKQFPIRLNPNVIGKVDSNYDWMEVISKRKFLKEGIDWSEDKKLLESIGAEIIDDDIEFMVDNLYDIKVLDKIIEYDPSLFTLSISRPLNSPFWNRKKNKDFFEWLNKMEKRNDTLVFVDETINHTQINDTYEK